MSFWFNASRRQPLALFWTMRLLMQTLELEAKVSAQCGLFGKDVDYAGERFS
jgi:hypothetical protein